MDWELLFCNFFFHLFIIYVFVCPLIVTFMFFSHSFSPSLVNFAAGNVPRHTSRTANAASKYMRRLFNKYKERNGDQDHPQGNIVRSISPVIGKKKDETFNLNNFFELINKTENLFMQIRWINWGIMECNQTTDRSSFKKLKKNTFENLEKN